MFCAKCGCQNDDNSAFCQNCGASLGEQQVNTNAAQQTVYTQSTYTQPNYQQNTYTSYQSAPKATVVRSSHPVLNLMKNIGASPLYMAAIIAFSVYVLLNIFSVFSASSGMFSFVEMFLDEMMPGYSYGYGYSGYGEVKGIITAVRTITTIIGIIGLLPPILLCVGMWLNFVAANNRNDGGLKTTGLTIIKIVTLIQAICSCVLAVIVDIFLLIGMVAIFSADGEGIGLYFLMILLINAYLVFNIFYQFKIVQTVGVIKTSAMTGTASDRVSVFVAVMCIISAVGSIILTLIEMAIPYIGPGALGFFTVLANSVSLVCFAVLLFSYKNQMRALMMSNSSAQYYN